VIPVSRQSPPAAAPPWLQSAAQARLLARIARPQLVPPSPGPVEASLGHGRCASAASWKHVHAPRSRPAAPRGDGWRHRRPFCVRAPFQIRGVHHLPDDWGPGRMFATSHHDVENLIGACRARSPSARPPKLTWNTPTWSPAVPGQQPETPGSSGGKLRQSQLRGPSCRRNQLIPASSTAIHLPQPDVSILMKCPFRRSRPCSHCTTILRGMVPAPSRARFSSAVPRPMIIPPDVLPEMARQLPRICCKELQIQAYRAGPPTAQPLLPARSAAKSSRGELEVGQELESRSSSSCGSPSTFSRSRATPEIAPVGDHRWRSWPRPGGAP